MDTKGTKERAALGAAVAIACMATGGPATAGLAKGSDGAPAPMFRIAPPAHLHLIEPKNGKFQIFGPQAKGP